MRKYTSRIAVTVCSLLVALAAILPSGGCGGGGTSGGGVTSTSASAGSATSSATTSTGLTDGGIGGTLASNTIFYWDSNTSIRSVKPDGTGDSLITDVPGNFIAVTLNPAVPNQYVFAYQTSASTNLGIYTNTSLSITGATSIVLPSYSDVVSLQVSPDGSTLYYVARTPGSTDTDGNLYKVALKSGSTPLALDKAESAHLNMKGDILVYTQFQSAVLRAQVFKRSTANVATPVKVLTDSNDDFAPQWNKTGDRIVFASIIGSSEFDLFSCKPDGTNVVQLTNTPAIDETSASFGPDGTQIAYIASNSDPTQSGIYKASSTVASSGTTLVLASPSAGGAIYWTGSNGRSMPSGFAQVRGLRTPKLKKH